MVETNGIGMHVAEKGAGPPVILCHRFPESCTCVGIRSRRYPRQVSMPSRRTCVAMVTDSPQAIDQFTLLHLVGDVIWLSRCPLASKRLPSLATTGERQSRGTPLCYVRTGFVR